MADGKGLIEVRVDCALTPERREWLQEQFALVAEQAGFVSVVLEPGVEMSVHHDLSPLVAAMERQTAMVGELVELNQAVLFELLAGDCVDVDDPDGLGMPVYLDGSPVE